MIGPIIGLLNTPLLVEGADGRRGPICDAPPSAPPNSASSPAVHEDTLFLTPFSSSFPSDREN